MSFYNKFVGISEWPAEAKRFTQVFGIIRISLAFVLSLTSTFFVLYILDALGFKQTSIVLTVMLSVQIVGDYPSGALSDRIGQRWLLTSATVMITVGMFLLAYATMFIHFIIIGAILGFANAQASGALESWYDNNYQKFEVPNDPEKKDYGYTLNQIKAITNFVMGTTFIIGGVLATAYGRADVFIIEGILCGFLTIFIFVWMKDILKENPSGIIEESSKPNFIDTFKGGITYLFGSKANIFLALGYTIILFVINIWGDLFLYPIYFGYSGSDKIAGLLRATIFFITVGEAILISKLTRIINKNKVALFFGIWTIGLFGGTALLLDLIPMKNQFSLIGCIIIIVLFTMTTGLLGGIAFVLIQRVILDFFPSEYRNSLYSFFPTARGILAIFFLPLTGSLIESDGMIAGVGLCMIFGIIGTISLELGMKGLSDKEIAIKNKQET